MSFLNSAPHARDRLGYQVVRSSDFREEGNNVSIMAGIMSFCYAIDVACMVLLAVVILIYRYALAPFHRGFFCDDTSISKPFKESTVPTIMALCVGQSLALVVFIVVELYERRRRRSVGTPTTSPELEESTSSSSSFANKIPESLKRIGVVYYAFLYGCLVTAVLTDIGKYAVGRLRPHFFSVCQPDWSSINCTDSRGLALYITDFKCLGKESLVREARLSFPSGHSSNALFTVIFLVLFLECRLRLPKHTQFLKVFTQIGVLAFGILCSLSRISDYKHHWSDVLAGMIIGTLVAFWIVCRNLRWRFSRAPPVLPDVEAIPMLGSNVANGVNRRQSDDKI